MDDLILGDSLRRKCFAKELQKQALSGTIYGAGYLKKKKKKKSKDQYHFSAWNIVLKVCFWKSKCIPLVYLSERYSYYLPMGETDMNC